MNHDYDLSRNTSRFKKKRNKTPQKIHPDTAWIKQRFLTRLLIQQLLWSEQKKGTGVGWKQQTKFRDGLLTVWVSFVTAQSGFSIKSNQTPIPICLATKAISPAVSRYSAQHSLQSSRWKWEISMEMTCFQLFALPPYLTPPRALITRGTRRSFPQQPSLGKGCSAAAGFVLGCPWIQLTRM